MVREHLSSGGSYNKDARTLEILQELGIIKVEQSFNNVYVNEKPVYDNKIIINEEYRMI